VNNFSGSIWHAVLVLLPLWITVFFIARSSLKKGHFYFFDPKHGQGLNDAGDFEPHCKRYQDIAKLTITLSAAAIAFLISIQISDKSPSTFAQKVVHVTPIVVGFFGTCIALMITFMVLQTYWYEQYSHSSTHSTYVRWKYALIVSFGWTGLLAFVLGFAWLAHNLFK